MKKYLKETWSAYVLSFVFCYMLFFYEPLTMYLSNVSDFWFGINTMFNMTSLLFLLVLLIMIIGLNVVYFLNRKKDKKIFKIITIILFVVFFCSYIQGNYLVSNLPLLDGSIIIWSDYKVDWIISIVLWIFVIGLVIILIKKLTLNKMIKYTGFVGLAIFIMLSLSLTSNFLTIKGLKHKDFIPLVTYNNINRYSKEKNLVVLLLDCVDSKAFMDRMNLDNDFNGMLKDFTYYPNTMSVHGFTDESIPLILTGEVYQNEKPLIEWATDAYKKSPLFSMLENNGYQLDVYEKDILYNDETALRIGNIINYDNNEKIISKIKFWKQEIKYIMFRYLPSILKRFSKIEEMHFGVLYLDNKSAIASNRFYDIKNSTTIEMIKRENVVKDDSKVFKFIHVLGAHAPWNIGKNYKQIKNGNYEDGIDAALTFTKDYLNFLKNNNLYDNSAVVIMSDHGFKTKDNNGGRQNPIFFVKGINEKRNKMETSNKALSFVDLNEMYNDLINDKKSNELFSNISSGRVRRFLFYKDANTKFMT